MTIKLNPNVNVNGKEKTAKTSACTNTDSPVVVNFFGGPGAGKSTAAAALFTLLKLHGVECELVVEYAKDLIWEERPKTLENQLYVFAKQQHRIWRVYNKVDITVIDSPLLLSNIYGKHYNRYCACTYFYDYVLAEFNRYNNINFFIEQREGYIESGRNESEEEAKIISKKIKDYLVTNDINYIPINRDTTGINTAVDTILIVLGGESKYKIIRK